MPNLRKIACITGSARRIGAHIAQYLHQNGYDVIIHHHRSHREALALQQLLNKERPSSAQAISYDLKNIDTLPDMVTNILDWKGRLDILVHNASIFSQDPPQFDKKWWDPLWTVNVTAPYILTTLMQDALAKHDGNIVYITDARTSPIPSYNAYYQTKAALTTQAYAFAKAFAPRIRVNMVAPGSIIWPEGENSLTAEEKIYIEKHIPLGICANPRVIAQAVLSCIENPFMTGVIVPVDGGARLSRNSP